MLRHCTSGYLTCCALFEMFFYILNYFDDIFDAFRYFKARKLALGMQVKQHERCGGLHSVTYNEITPTSKLCRSIQCSCKNILNQEGWRATSLCQIENVFCWQTAKLNGRWRLKIHSIRRIPYMYIVQRIEEEVDYLVKLMDVSFC